MCRTVEVLDAKGVEPAPVVEPVRSNGAIFQDDRYRPLFEDHRARLVGDTLTVLIIEKVSATQKSTSTIDSEAKLEATLTAVPLASANSFNRARAEAEHNSNFSGKGTTENSNDFSGTITATVVRVLPNGHLIVAGEKQIGVNANVDVLRFSGQVDPRAIAAGQQRAVHRDRQRAHRAARPRPAGRGAIDGLAVALLPQPVAGMTDSPDAPSAPPPGGHHQRPGKAGSAVVAWIDRIRGSRIARGAVEQSQ